MKPSDATATGAAAAAANCPAVLKRMLRSRVNRRNTMDCAILNEMFVDDDCAKFTAADKRSKQLLRESERDMKRATLSAIGPSASLSVVEAANMHLLGDGQTTSGDRQTLDGPMLAAAVNASATAASQTNSICGAMPMLIKCSNPYKSVSTRPVGCRTSAPAIAFPTLDAASASAAAQLTGRMGGRISHAAADCKQLAEEDGLTCRFDRTKLQVRREFHETFANLIKLGSDKQDNRVSERVRWLDFGKYCSYYEIYYIIQASNEIDTWQTELKDLIWLELQAWHAERTPEEQDRYLCAARQDVPKLLDRILHYRFQPAYLRETSTDSGVSTGSADSYTSGPQNECKNCISLYCKNCQQQQCTALREVEELLTRLEAAEALYPSSQVIQTGSKFMRSFV